MSYMLELPDELFALLQKHAVPLVDTPLTVIERALRALEAGDEVVSASVSSGAMRTFNPASAPNLTYTNLLKAKVGSKQLPKSDTYWNSLMYAVILEAAARRISSQDILDLITVNSQLGRREDNGFRYLEGANISIQGQDANSAWRQTYELASSFGILVEATFAWPDNPKAAMPSVKGSFYIDGN